MGIRPEETPRVVFIMVDEDTVDNIVYVRENMEREHHIKPENLSDVIAVLINYWLKGKRSID